ncbi:hypothetical protein DFR42_1153 [Undibacterium pigrum]|uniref:Uncharacterized protein n=1 Tax=Undibacterium pigrum TaxID=401470 RepID=A0A318IRV1_9BURK|nr:hypothetical protein DFR42_1153 [Undibacterium pigrum]
MPQFYYDQRNFYRLVELAIDRRILAWRAAAWMLHCIFAVVAVVAVAAVAAVATSSGSRPAHYTPGDDTSGGSCDNRRRREQGKYRHFYGK